MKFEDVELGGTFTLSGILCRRLTMEELNEIPIQSTDHPLNAVCIDPFSASFQKLVSIQDDEQIKITEDYWHS